MTAAAPVSSAARIRVPAGTTAAAAARDAGLPGRGEPNAIVVVRDADGRLRDLSWTPDTDAEVSWRERRASTTARNMSMSMSRPWQRGLRRRGTADN